MIKKSIMIGKSKNILTYSRSFRKACGWRSYEDKISLVYH